NGSTKRNGFKYDYQYYVCKSCGYKFGTQEVHNRFIPEILNRVKELISINQTVPKTLAFINEMSNDVEQSIQTKNHLLLKLEEKLKIARDLKDRELELKILDFIQQHKDSLKEYTACKESLKATYQLVENDHFFSRFNEVLEYQLGTDEKRLIILYFVDCLILSTDQEPQLHYKSNIFSNLIHPLDEVPKHQR
ncbi:hypothetical protein, partial [Bacillus xiapuensis]|nr:hypothetical protein [Bacillus xiapuensis]